MAKMKASQFTTQTLAEVFPEFIISCRVKNLAASSIENYRDKYIKLTTIIPESTSCANIDRKMVDSFILALQEQGLADASINTIIRSNRVLFYWCME